MDVTTIWHNPRCSKSRQTVALLEERGVKAKIRVYLKEPPTADELQTVLILLGKTPTELVRTCEPIYKELALQDADDAAVFAAMVANPILIERPIVIQDDKAAIGRPPENVLSLF